MMNLERSDQSPILYIVKDPWGYLIVEVAGFRIEGYKPNPSGSIKKVTFYENNAPQKP